jgi:hypothetical protein
VPLPLGNPKDGVAEIDAETKAALLGGGLYVNIHSEMHPAGEIRGQISSALALTTIRALTEDQGGDPDHPILQGLTDENGDIPIADASQFDLNTAYPFLGAELAALNGSGFKTTAEILAERGWGPGNPETQFGGWPVTEGAAALASFVNPCTHQTFFQVDAEGNLTTADGRGHLALIAAEAGSPRIFDPNTPDLCDVPEDCQFASRAVFWFMSDRGFPYSTAKTLKLVRRMALWALGLLDQPGRSDTPFLRGDSSGDGQINIADPLYTLEAIFLGTQVLRCEDAADSNDDENPDIADPIFTLFVLFIGGVIPPTLESCFQGCQLDFTPDASFDEAVLSCESYAACR